MIFDYKAIEDKWKSKWKSDGLYAVDIDPSKPKYYVLDMFPYPSGAGLHVGHPLGYIASDIFSRQKRMKGFNVLHPMGFDAFGLPAEEYALATGIHPATSTHDNMKRYREQLSNLGFSYDWDREVYTCDPGYYKWTQWIFTQLYEHYYDLELESAQPVQSLVDQFSSKGNEGVNAATSQQDNFTAEEWNSWNRKEQSEVLMHYRLAYRKVGYVNWCEALGTVLANDQVKDGVSERGAHPVVQKAMTQWYLRITAYADRLLEGLDNIEWSNSLKTIQTNWIGKSEGASIFFEIVNSDEHIEIFTTRPDTIFGATYMVLAPEHDLVKQLTTSDRHAEVTKYLDYVKSKSEIERMSEKEVTGVFIGSYAINPFTNTQIPIWIGEYVLKDYGTGAIMAVPSDDDRDMTFATKFDLPIIDIVDKSDYPGATTHDKVGKIINSGFLTGMEVPEAIKAANAKVEEMGIGKAVSNYKMRDANFSRQRYWGEPFPVKFDQDGIPEILPIDELPLELPDTDDFKPGREGKSPLARLTDWVNAEEGFQRETDVMPAVAGSSWYWLRYMDPNNENEFASQESIKYWESVDLYIGGSEHAVAHLMYARFWHKFLFDKGLVPTDEPFKKLVNQGMIQGVVESIVLLREKENGHHKFLCSQLAEKRNITDFVKIPVHIDFVVNYGSPNSYMSIESFEKFIEWRPDYKDAIYECSKGIYHKGKFTPKGDSNDANLVTLSATGKMSKSLYNVINPDGVTAKYGTDCFRMYEMFLGPIEQSKPWDTKGIDGISKFLRKFVDLYFSDELLTVSDADPSDEEFKIVHTAIKKVNSDIENLSFNTAISAMMVCVNELRRLNCDKRKVLDPLVRLIAPFAPFISEEIWLHLGNNTSIHLESYPEHDEKYLVEDQIEYPICINGKKRGLESFAADASVNVIQESTLQLDYVQKWIEGKTVRKVIVVPGRMVNIVV